jgi:hypothetical protein
MSFREARIFLRFSRTAQLAERRGRLNALMPCVAERRWPVPWPAEAAALLDDPEAALTLDEAAA